MKSIKRERNNKAPFSMALENLELMHECSHQYFSIGVRHEWNEIDSKDGKEKRMNMEPSNIPHGVAPSRSSGLNLQIVYLPPFWRRGGGAVMSNRSNQ